jgi:hypothetical protein
MLTQRQTNLVTRAANKIGEAQDFLHGYVADLTSGRRNVSDKELHRILEKGLALSRVRRKDKET